MENQTFQICVDADEYYTEGNDGTLVEVREIPQVDNPAHLTAYKYNKETLTLTPDIEKIKQIDEDVRRKYTLEERVKILEGAILEMASTVYGG